MPVPPRTSPVVICALIALAASPAQAQEPTLPSQPETARAWLARCGEPAPDPRASEGGQTACTAWVEGLVDLNEIYRGLGALEKTPEGFCTPREATVADAARAVSRYFRDHPDALHVSARILAYMALRHAFPCERRTS